MNSLRRNSNRSPRRDRPSNPAPARRVAPKPDNDNFRPRPKPANDNVPRRFRPGSLPRGAAYGAKAMRLFPYVGLAMSAYELYQWYNQPWTEGQPVTPPHAGYQQIAGPCTTRKLPETAAEPATFTPCFTGVLARPWPDWPDPSPNTYTIGRDNRPAGFQTITANRVFQRLATATGPAAPFGLPEVPPVYAPPEWQLPPPAVMPALDPLSVPIGIPVPVPMPIPYPAVPYRPRTNPHRAPDEQPQRGPNPASRPSPRPRPGRPLKPGQAVGADTAPGSKPFSPAKPHGRRPPGRNTKEKKLFDRSAGTGLGAASRVFGAMTEACDVAEALHDALPKAMQVSGGCVDKAWAVYGNFEAVDWNKAVDNLIANQVEDKAWGKIFGMRERTARNLGLHSGAAVPLGF